MCPPGNKYHQPLPRSIEILIGGIAAVGGAFLLYVAVVDLHPLPGIAPAAAFFAALGVVCLFSASKLLFANQRTRDRGLLSPGLLKAAAIAIIVLPLALLVVQPGWDVRLLFRLPQYIAYAAACWGLARFRQKQLRSVHEDEAHRPPAQ